MSFRKKSATKRELRIQVVAADPATTSDQMLEQEISTIKRNINNDYYEPVFVATRTENRNNFAKTVREFHPDIVNFTSHGSPQGKIMMETRAGWNSNITGNSLAALLNRAECSPELVILNNCSVFRDLEAVSKIGSTVINIRHPVDGVDISPTIARELYKRLTPQIPYKKLVLAVMEEINSASGENVVYQILPCADAIDKYSSPVRDILELDAKLSAKEAQDLFEPELKVRKISETMAREQDTASSATAFLVGREISESCTPANQLSGPRRYRVWFGTNREPIDGNDYSKGFDSNRSDEVHYGYCDVVIPKYHRIGSIGDPWWRRFPAFWRSNKLSIHEMACLSYQRYWQELRSLYDTLSTDDRSLLIFIHGYNVTFDNAAIRAAQLGIDLSVPGATAFFSWPSQGTLLGYPADAAAIEASEYAIGRFISDMAAKSGADKVHLIAHSMGNRGLLRAFSAAFAGAKRSTSLPIEQVFLAAPDVDTELFKSLASVYPQISKRTTMYVSAADKALLSSGIIHHYPRAGFTPPVTVVDGIDTVEASKIDLTFLGHGYIGNARPVLQDMHMLMENDTPPKKRFGLKEIIEPSGISYWQVCP